MGFTVHNLTKRFGQFPALENVDLSVPEGTLVVLLGPSGSGKSTLLHIIAGLEHPDTGSVRNGSAEITYRSAQDRAVGLVFQQNALFRQLTVSENIAFALRVRRWDNAAIEARVAKVLDLVRLDGLDQRLPSHLSGGQRQRVAVAAALAARPHLLLLDEPFDGLDAQARRELRQWLCCLHNDLHQTTILATRNAEEAFELADRVAVMGHGRIQQTAVPLEICEHPANAFVRDFLGKVNVFQGRVENGKALLGDLALDFPEYRDFKSRPAELYVRPDELEVDREPLIGGCGLTATVVHIHAAGPVVRLCLEVQGYGLDIHVEVALERWAELQLQRGDAVYVSPRRAKVHVLDYQI
jgi:sulfate/thiosulfate transport system ATP-binding protein